MDFESSFSMRIGSRLSRICMIVSGLTLALTGWGAVSAEFPVLKGPYFGQTAPVERAALFMDGIISSAEQPEMNAAFTRDGREFYYCARYAGRMAVFTTSEREGGWTEPRPMPFTSDRYDDRDLTISPDGNRIYFGSNRPRHDDGDALRSLRVFYIERVRDTEWSRPIDAGNVINGAHGGNYPSAAANGNLYFFSSRPEGIGLSDIYMAEFANDRFSAPVCLDVSVNSEKHDWDAYVAPDESYLIFSSKDRSDTLGGQDLYISFKGTDGKWTLARNMGARVNSGSSEICPSVSLDGRYFFFTSRRRGNADIYWIDARIIRDLKVGTS